MNGPIEELRVLPPGDNVEGIDHEEPGGFVMRRQNVTPSVTPKAAVCLPALVVSTFSLWVLPSARSLALDGPPIRSLERTIGLRIASPQTSIRVSGSWLVFAVRERDQEPPADLNGDGDRDSFDLVIYKYNLESATANNLGLTVSWMGGYTVTDNWLIVEVYEGDQGESDLNGDGDTWDGVYHVHNLETGESRNLRLASGSCDLRGTGSARSLVSGNWLAFTVSEAGQGHQDLNGDGDTGDFVLHLHNLVTGATTNLGLALRDSGFLCSSAHFCLSDNRLRFRVSEAAQGAQDLNGDGDTEDHVVHEHDLEGGATKNLETTDEISCVGDHQWRVFTMREDDGTGDLNGDGDTDDNVLHARNVDDGTITNLEMAVVDYRLLAQNWLAFTVSEAAQGNQDLNGDEDVGDFVLHLHNLATGATTNLGATSSMGVLSLVCASIFAGRFVVFEVFEADQGAQDLNGDGDALDDVLHVYDLLGTTTVNLGVVTARFGGITYAGGRLAFTIDEERHGMLDRNGDGDALDQVLHLRDLESGMVTNLELAVAREDNIPHPLLYGFGDRLVFLVDEVEQGAGDLNGDGDVERWDAVLHVHNIERGVTTNLGLAVCTDEPIFVASGDWLLFFADETLEERDLNGDGDAHDHTVPHLACLSVLDSLPHFLRGDPNDDGNTNIADSVFVLNHLFGGGPAPSCLQTADANDDNALNIADPVYLLNHLFGGGPGLAAPVGECGIDLTPRANADDDLPCEAYPLCE